MALTNIRSWEASWNRKIKKIENKVEKTPSDIARYGALRSKVESPKKTGTIAQAITWKKQKGGRAYVILRPFRNKTQRGIHGDVQYYVWLHHKNPLGWKYQAKNRDPHWVFNVRDEVKDKFGKDLRFEIGKEI